MTKDEFNDLFNMLCYGHDADISVAGQRYFLEWNNTGMIIYKMQGDVGEEITRLYGENKNRIVNALFDYEFLGHKSLNSSHQEFDILDIE